MTSIIDRVLGGNSEENLKPTPPFDNGVKEGAITSTEDSVRIAKLTSDATKAAGERLVDEVKQTIESAENGVTMLRLEADNLIEEIRRHTGNFADRVSGFVSNCNSARQSFRSVQAKLGDMPNGVINWDVNDPDNPKLR